MSCPGGKMIFYLCAILIHIVRVTHQHELDNETLLEKMSQMISQQHELYSQTVLQNINHMMDARLASLDIRINHIASVMNGIGMKQELKNQEILSKFSQIIQEKLSDTIQEVAANQSSNHQELVAKLTDLAENQSEYFDDNFSTVNTKLNLIESTLEDFTEKIEPKACGENLKSTSLLLQNGSLDTLLKSMKMMEANQEILQQDVTKLDAIGTEISNLTVHVHSVKQTQDVILDNQEIVKQDLNQLGANGTVVNNLTAQITSLKQIQDLMVETQEIVKQEHNQLGAIGTGINNLTAQIHSVKQTQEVMVHNQEMVKQDLNQLGPIEDNQQSILVNLAEVKSDLTNFGPTEANQQSILVSLTEIKSDLTNLDGANCIGGVIVGYQCLIFSKEALTWVAARYACYSNGGRLASLADPAAVLAYVKKNHGGENFWTGGKYDAEEGIWKWLNGEPFDEQFPWASGEPSSGVVDGVSQHCVSMNYDGGFDNDWCNDNAKLRYVCEQM